MALSGDERFLRRAAAAPPTPDSTGRDALYAWRATSSPVRRAWRDHGADASALASPAADPAFAPEPVSPGDVRRGADSFRRQGDGCSADLSRRLGGDAGLLPATITRGPAAGGRAAGGLRLRGDDLAVLAEGGSVKVRIHGDYHLGQVLRGADDAPDGGEWYPIDFEGEPTRPLEERRAKQSVLRDVAGMLRSFDYAVRLSMREFRADDLAVRMSVQRWADAWRAEVRSLFVSAYRETLGDSPVVPRDPDAMLRALAVFELEKAIYEMGYEMNNRPEWIWVPLQGVLALAGEAGA